MTPYIPNEHAEALLRALERVAALKRTPRAECLAARIAIDSIKEQMESPVYVRSTLHGTAKDMAKQLKNDLAALMPTPGRKRK